MTGWHSPLRAGIVLAALLLAREPAQAQNKISRLALESHVGARPKEVQRAMVYLRSALDRRGFVATPAEVRRVLGAHLPGPGIADPAYTARQFSKDVEDGSNGVIRERYDDAIKKLKSALEKIDQNPLILAKDPTGRESRLEAMIYLARAYDIRGKAAGAEQVMTELIRSHPDKVLTATTDGDRAETLYKKTKAQLERAGRGELLIEVSDPNVTIYVDGVVRGRGKNLFGDLIPGRHTVVLENAARAARVFRPGVLANQRTRLVINWDIDSVLVTADWAGFLFVTEHEQAREGELAVSLASDRTDAVAVAVVTASLVEHQLRVTGSVRRTLGGVEERRGAVVLSGRGDQQKLDHLAVFLDDGTRNAAVIEEPVQKPTPPPVVEPPASTRHPLDSPFMPVPPEPARHGLAARAPTQHSHSAWEWGSGTIGAALVVAGGVAVALDQRGDIDARNISWALVIGGSAWLATAYAAHYYDKRRARPVVMAAPVRGGGVGAVQWCF